MHAHTLLCATPTPRPCRRSSSWQYGARARCACLPACLRARRPPASRRRRTGPEPDNTQTLVPLCPPQSPLLPLPRAPPPPPPLTPAYHPLPPQGFSRGSSTFRGVTAHPSGRWESRIGIPGSKHIYLGLWEGEQDAASAYDRALVRLRGTAAATNFGLAEYRLELAEYHQIQQVGRLGS